MRKINNFSSFSAFIAGKPPLYLQIYDRIVSISVQYFPGVSVEKFPLGLVD